MILPHGRGDLYHKYRPLRFEEIAGHKDIISSLKSAVLATEPSQAYLLVGDSGTGKTSSARIIALTLNCSDRDSSGEPCLKCKTCSSIITGNNPDIIEVNCADRRGIDAIRNLCSTMPMMPMTLTHKVYILDEAHQLTKEAQSSLLKELEEAPKHATIILCTTDPQKLLRTVKTRCQQFTFKGLVKRELVGLLESVATFETYEYPPNVYGAIADAALGSPRQALVYLQQIAQLGEAEPGAIQRLLETGDTTDKGAFALCQELSSSRRSWGKLMSLYDNCKELGPPAIGMVIAGYYRNRLIKAKNPAEAEVRASILELFVTPLAEGKLGENSLILNLYKAHTAR